MFSKTSFFGSRSVRFDSITAEAGEEDEGLAVTVENGYAELCFLRAMSFSWLNMNDIEYGERLKSDGAISADLVREEIHLRAFCVARYHKNIDRITVSADIICETLDCIRLSWQLNRGIPGSSTSWNVYGLILVDTVRENVHIFKFDEVLQNVFHSKQKRNAIFGIAWDRKQLEFRALLCKPFTVIVVR